ncbi:MAG: amidohydrolase [Peptococcaceae bacterium]|nr:amidohydrolase [Peptococcaceae bacterium]
MADKMITKEELKAKIIEEIDRRSEEIIGIGRRIFQHPELGFKERKTSELASGTLKSLGLACEEGLAITGVKAVAKGRQSKARVMVMGELDAVVCPLHPCADPQTGAAHSCGHNSQIATMLGAAMGLTPFMEHLDGDAVFVAVPAEEYVELEYRERLREEGKIRFFGGKQEFIRTGVFEDVDMGMMIHSHAGVTQRKFLLDCDSSGFVGKVIRYTGKEAHAGAEPFAGINALNAAALSLMAINSQRETFKDSDRIRVHPIITKGGDLVNIVPADVRMETYVRGRTIDAVVEASEKVNRAIQGSAYAIGAQVEIKEEPGYLPLIQDKTLTGLFEENAARLFGREINVRGYELMGATDAGDVSSIMPFIHVSTGGYAGTAHSKDFTICDEEMAYVYPAKVMALTVVDLLWDEAGLAKEVKAGYKPRFDRQGYVSFWSAFSKTK